MVTKIDASMFDAQGKEIILDADADTSITADTDNQIDIKIAGADDFRFTANNFNVLSGSTLTVDSGATITNSGTATGFGVALANDGDNRVVTGTGSGGLNGEANLSFDGTTLAITGTVEPSGDTSAGDNAAMGYTAAEGLILTGQGSTDDITIKNDADTTVLNVATGATDVEISAGNILFGTAAKGVYLGVTSATAANLLDDYEEGLHVTTLTGYGSGNWVMQANMDTLSYTKVGRLVHIQGLIEAASDNSASGQLTISLPFTQLATSEGGSNSKPFMLIYNHGDGGIENAYCSNSPGVSDTYGANITDGGTAEVIDHSRLDAAFVVNINMCYYAA